MRNLVIAIVLSLVGLMSANAEDRLPNWDIVSRFGIAYKDSPVFSSSYLMSEECIAANVSRPANHPRAGGGSYSCGGDNPAFIGYPIAWKRVWGEGVWTGYFGIFHQSQWLDNRGEMQWTGPAIEVEFNWSAWKRNRRK